MADLVLGDKAFWVRDGWVGITERCLEPGQRLGMDLELPTGHVPASFTCRYRCQSLNKPTHREMSGAWPKTWDGLTASWHPKNLLLCCSTVQSCLAGCAG